MTKANSNYNPITGDILAGMSDDKKFVQYRKAWVNNPKNNIVGNFPLHIDVESTNRCNLKCLGCARTSDQWCSGGIGDMDFDLFKKIVDEGRSNGLYSIKLSLRGEPMLHKRLFDMVEYVLVQGIIDLYFNTNGMFLSKKNCQRIVDSGLKRISISVDGWDKKSFEYYRSGAKYEKVVSGVMNLIAARKKAGKQFPKVRVQAVLFDEIKKNIDKIVNFWKDTVDEIGMLDAREEGAGVDHRGKYKEEFVCPFLWQRMMVLFDGSLFPCLMHGVKDYDLLYLGNVREVSIAEKWSSAMVNELRNMHLQGRSHEIKACDQCSYRASEISKNFKKIEK